MKRACVIVTGGAQGIGAAVARCLAAGDFNVAVFDRKRDAGETELNTCRAFFEVDVSDESSVRHGIEAVSQHFGQIGALVNNAGISNPDTGALESLSLAQWNRIIGTNLTGYFLCAKHALPFIRRCPGGAIINIASTRALQSEPHTEAYASSKGGIVALTHALAISLGPAVRVDCISPGWIAMSQDELRAIDHEQHPVGRVGKPRDVAALVALLLSADAGFITGQNFVVDGGITRKMIYA
ncbi:MAG: SDR family oxidoreductase [Gammaproteobacteria bacterium]|nr:SDR family oxidoreductase [Gammaproteobacteria bacterium]